MLKRIAWLLIAFPTGLILVALAVANRQPVRLSLDPFHAEAPALSLVLPFYVYVIGALIIGSVLGGLATWMSQGRWRRLARTRWSELRRWRSEADRLTRERDQTVAQQRTKAITSGSSSVRDAA